MERIIFEIIGVIMLAVSTSFVFIKYSSKRILDHQFNKSIEKYKHDIHSEFDRISKIHQKEFEILPELWRLLQNVIGIMNALSTPLQYYPAMDKLNGDSLNEFLLQSKLDASDAESIKQATLENRLNVYRKKNSLVQL